MVPVAPETIASEFGGATGTDDGGVAKAYVAARNVSLRKLPLHVG